MRSYGGAVQGIRELPLEVYLNRADDGFLFLNDGTYTSGPVQWTPDETLNAADHSTGSNSTKFLASIALNAATRLVAMGGTSTTETGTAIILTKKGKDLNYFACETMDLSAPKEINWHTHIRCKMPSASMPWMLQRAKWERWNSGDETTPSQGPKTIQHCINKLVSFEDAHAKLSLPLSIWEGNGSDEKGHAVISVACESASDSAAYVSVAREYIANKLTSVVWSYGWSQSDLR